MCCYLPEILHTLRELQPYLKWVQHALPCHYDLLWLLLHGEGSDQGSHFFSSLPLGQLQKDSRVREVSPCPPASSPCLWEPKGHKPNSKNTTGIYGLFHISDKAQHFLLTDHIPGAQLLLSGSEKTSWLLHLPGFATRAFSLHWMYSQVYKEQSTVPQALLDDVGSLHLRISKSLQQQSCVPPLLYPMPLPA